MTDPLESAGAPYVRLRMRDARPVMEGEAHVELGWPLIRKGREEGVFARWRWEDATFRAHAGPHGFYPLFYWQRGAELVVSPSLLKLLECGAPTDLDDDAVAVFLRIGYFVGDDTPFRAIRGMPAGATLTWRDGATTIEACPHAAPPPLAIGRDEAAQTYGELVRESVRTRLELPGPRVIPLSGGRDSRHMLFAMLDSGLRPDECITLHHFPPRANEDLRIAREVCAEFDLPHTVIPQPASRLAAERRKNRLTHLLCDEHAWYLPMADHLAGRDALVFDGVAGSVFLSTSLHRQEVLDDFENGRFETLAARMLPEGYLPRQVGRSVYGRIGRDRAVARFTAELALHADQPNPMSSFLFANRTRREIGVAPTALLGRAARVCFPFLDLEVHSFLRSLPARTVLDGGLHTAAIRACYPQWAYIPFEAQIGDDAPDGRHFRRFASELMTAALRRPRGALLRRRFLLARGTRVLVDPRYAEAVTWWGPFVAWLLDLEEAIAG